MGAPVTRTPRPRIEGFGGCLDPWNSWRASPWNCPVRTVNFRAPSSTVAVAGYSPGQRSVAGAEAGGDAPASLRHKRHVAFELQDIAGCEDRGRTNDIVRAGDVLQLEGNVSSCRRLAGHHLRPPRRPRSVVRRVSRDRDRRGRRPEVHRAHRTFHGDARQLLDQIEPTSEALNSGRGVRVTGAPSYRRHRAGQARRVCTGHRTAHRRRHRRLRIRDSRSRSRGNRTV